ncbi:MAG: DUF2997 domain-containing protein [Candidatus Lokiarchaeota archaeon]|nr:DUF2997 domain-containing protein [Candidatus Lokiarchaeota archaeon]
MQEMKVIISKNGQVTIDVDGIKGSSCKTMTKALEKSLGITVSDKKKTEFYEEQQVDNQQNLGNY